MRRASRILGILSLSLWALIAPSFAAEFWLQTWDHQVGISHNRGGDEYPEYYWNGALQGGPFTSSIDTTEGIGGGQSLRIDLQNQSGELYAQFEIGNGIGFDFAHTMGSCGYPFIAACGPNPLTSWQTNTYNRFEYWIKVPTNSSGVDYGTGVNFNMAEFQRAWTKGEGSDSQECRNCHFYHGFSVEPTGTWWRIVHNWHPDHERQVEGTPSTSLTQYVTAHVASLRATPEDSGFYDPPATYNYWDTLARFYIQSNPNAGGPWKFDQMRFYSTAGPEDEEQLVGALAGTYIPATTRFVLNWEHIQFQNSVQWDVRYAYSDIHGVGWNNATVAPGSPFTPISQGTYQQAHWESTTIPTAGHTSVFFAVRSHNTTIGDANGFFTQIEIPLNPTAAAAPDTDNPTVPGGLVSSAIKSTSFTVNWTTSTDPTVPAAQLHYDWRINGGATTSTQPGVTSATVSNLTPSTLYSFDVQAFDPAGNPSAFSTALPVTTAAPDVTAPSVPTWGTATAINANQINLAWNASTDNMDASADLRYEVYRNSSLIATTNQGNTAYSDTTVTVNTTYTYTLIAKDTSANFSALSATKQATTPADTLGIGLVAAYAFNEGTGTTVADQAGGGHPGTLSGNFTWVVGHTGTGGGMQFNGSTGRMVNSSLASPADKSISFWVFPQSHTGDFNTLVEFANDNPWLGFRSNGIFEVYPGVQTLSAIPLNQWTHLAYTCDIALNQGKIYVNGSLAVTGVSNSSTGFGLGVGLGLGDTAMVGIMDDLRIHDRPLSAPEVTQAMNTPIGEGAPNIIAPAPPANLRLVSP